jgi:membrane protease YdiL (CAAX protease family)
VRVVPTGKEEFCSSELRAIPTVPRVQEERRWELLPIYRLIALIGISVVVGSLVLGGIGRQLAAKWRVDEEFIAHLIAFASLHGIGLLWIHQFLRGHNVSWIEGFGLMRKPGRSIALGLLVTLVALPIATIVIGGLVTALLQKLGLNPETQRTVTLVREVKSLPQIIVLGLAAAVLAPVFEEAFFRGVLFRAVYQRGHHPAAWIGTSALFAGIHFNLAAFFPLVFLAVVFAWLYRRTGNLLAPISGHALFNALNFWMLVAPPKWLEKFLGQ